MTSSETDQANYLEGQLLVAMPGMSDPRFERSVIYLCAHSAEGAMGIVINQLVESLTFPDLLQQLDIDHSSADETIRVHFGGPVETGRGFVLHSSEYLQDSSLRICDEVALTATIDILKDMANGQGPHHSLLAIGYAGWGPGQLDEELQANGWLTVEPDPDLIFQPDLEEKWNKAIGKLGFDVSKLSGAAGHA
ncbi:YqgE/AlgH family protein [Fodinicurvata fenggangensis]|uniref:YqgE/AlgH family protein n=1 Tax=Fodinicurvata fenggangensis TaxID=1121830 RepID=UPI00047C1FA3|nr:YqgE/AlgH family protein [Fodinicurvata fenggangensis]